MYHVKLRKTKRIRRKYSVKKSIKSGLVNGKPRLTVFRSNKYIYAQIINDEKGHTLLSLDSEVKKIHKGKTKVEAAFELGKELAAKAIEKHIKEVVFDRNGYRYHGRVKSLADGAREGGLSL